MIADRIVRYLQQNGVAWVRRGHPRAVTAQELAASLHLTGFRVAKTVVADVDGQPWLCVLPAAEQLDELRLAQVLDARRVDLADESLFEDLFPDCELGAEPPFGALYGLPVVLDESLASAPTLVVRAGSHEEAIELATADLLTLEHPRIAAVAAPPAWQRSGAVHATQPRT